MQNSNLNGGYEYKNSNAPSNVHNKRRKIALYILVVYIYLMVIIHYENTVTPYNVWRMSDEVRQRIVDSVRRRMKIKWEQVTTMEHLRSSRCAQQGAVLKYSGKVLMTGLLRQ